MTSIPAAAPSEVKYGGFWIRVAAHVIDGMLIVFIILPVNLAVYGADYLESTKVVAGPVDFIVSWVLPAIAVILFWKYREATPGKMLLELRIVDAQTGSHPSTPQYVGRYFGYIISMLPLGLGFLWAAWDPKKQSWHDKLAGTVVLRGKNMRRTAIAALLCSVLLPSAASATWSVVAVDRSTGRIVIASATCVDRDDAFLRGVQAVIVPGRGVAACQASVDGTHTNQMLVFNELAKGTDPARIIEMLSQDPAFQSRQFGIVDLKGRSAGHSGLTNGYVTQDIQGRVPGTQIYYSIQGNILRPGEVVPRAVKAFLETNGALTDRVMAALEAADAAGGDSRCTCPTTLTDTLAAGIPCEGKTSHVAYISMAERNDTNGDSHNNGTYAMYLTVTQPRSGGPNAIRAGENLNPVKTLRMRYDAWRKTQPASFR